MSVVGITFTRKVPNARRQRRARPNERRGPLGSKAHRSLPGLRRVAFRSGALCLSGTWGDYRKHVGTRYDTERGSSAAHNCILSKLPAAQSRNKAIVSTNPSRLSA